MYRAASYSDPVVYATQFGAVGDDSHDDAPGINAAISFVKNSPTGKGTIVIPPGEYRMLTEVVLDSDDLSLVIQAGATLYQDTYGYSAVQIRANGCTVTGGGKLVNEITKTEIVGAGAQDGYEGNPKRSRSAGVYVIGADNYTISDITIEGFVCGVPFYQSEGLRLTSNCFGGRILNVTLRHFDFGFVGSNQDLLLIDGCSGYYTDRSQGDDDDDDDNGPAPHLVYISGSPAKSIKSRDVKIVNCQDYFNPHSSSYKAKHVTGLQMIGLQSLGAMRGIDLWVQRFSVINPSIIDLLGQPGINCNSDCSDGQIVDPYIYVTQDLSAYSALLADAGVTAPTSSDINLIRGITFENTCSDITIRGGKIRHDHTSNEFALLLGGNNVKCIDTEFVEAGFNAFPVSIRSGSVNCKLIRPDIKIGSTFTITSGTYDGGTGVAVLTTTETIRFGNGTPITISGTTGTGDFADLDGAQTAITPITANTLSVQLATGLTMTITGATMASGGFRICDISGATPPVGTVVEVDPYVLNFTSQSNSITDSGTDSIVRYVYGSTSGIWTPAPTFATVGDFSATVTTADGWYTRNGDLVTVGFSLLFTTNAYTTASGDFRITGLPYAAVTPLASGGYTYSAAVGFFGNISGTIDGLGITLGVGDSYLSVRRNQTANAGANITVSNIAASTANVRVHGQITYKAAA